MIMKHKWYVFYCGILIVLVINQVVLAGDNWPSFRGPTNDGISDAKGLPVEWSESQNIQWKTAIHDQGWSTPVIWENQIWVTTATEEGHNLYAVCVDFKSGKIIHDILVFEVEDPQRKHPLNSYATPSPVIEKGRVYVHFGTHGTACLDTKSGKILWKRDDLNCNHVQGSAGSPFLYKHLLILHLEGNDVQFVIALDKMTGKTVWKTDRPKEQYEKAIPLYRKGYSTPIIIQVDGKDQLISTGAQMCHAYDPLTGEEIWSVYYGTDSTISAPISYGGLVFISTGYQQPSPELWAVRPTGKGDVTESHVVWKIKERVPIESSPIVKSGLVYMVNDKGQLSCIDARTGQFIWRENLKGEFGASPVYADGQIFFCNKKGVTTVIPEGREYGVISSNGLDAGFLASPAIKGNSFILRTRTHLYRVGGV
ncbi:PQQ-like beta-propeller repeat protein [candidate division KSB1 bacterium]|nr:PQQ-like beta-propeller repeat protein [candidate division KSB1 bacterium]